MRWGRKEETKRGGKAKEGESEDNRVREVRRGESSLCGTRSQSVGYAPRLGRDRQGQPLLASSRIYARATVAVLFFFTFIYLFINIPARRVRLA